MAERRPLILDAGLIKELPIGDDIAGGRIGPPGFDGESPEPMMIPGPAGPTGPAGASGSGSGSMGPPGIDGEPGSETFIVLPSKANFSETTVTLTTGTLADAATETGTISIARNFLIKKVVIDRYSEVRLYGDSSARTADITRLFGDFSFVGSQSRYITGLKLTASTGLTWFMSPPAVGENTDSPTSATIYYYVKNNSGSSHSVQIDFHVLILEA
jgi:hypothetical protein